MAEEKDIIKVLREKIKMQDEYIEQLEAIIDQSFYGLCVADNKGNIIKVNKSHTRITGTPPHEILGKNLKDLEKNGQMSTSVTMRILEAKQPLTLEQRLPNGRTYIAQGSPVFDEAGNIKYVVTNLVDITEIQKLKEELEKVKLNNEQFRLQLNQLKTQSYRNSRIIYRSKKMQNVVELAVKIAGVDSTVLILGASGVGKELIARFIHDESYRKDKPFIKINCGAIPENLLESELFGYEPGSFTGALKSGKKGLFEYANSGTLLLDEIGDLPLNLQVKLLRVLQEGEILRIGGNKPIPVDVRIIAATNADLPQMVRKGTFRQDLYYRLNVIPICIPSLKERKEDIPLLVEYFRKKFNEKYNLGKKFSPDAVEYLMEISLPGNVRELENIIERAILLSERDTVEFRDLKRIAFLNQTNGEQEMKDKSLKEILEEKEKEILKKYFRQYRTTQRMAEVLGVNQSTISRKLIKYGIK